MEDPNLNQIYLKVFSCHLYFSAFLFIVAAKSHLFSDFLTKPNSVHWCCHSQHKQCVLNRNSPLSLIFFLIFQQRLSPATLGTCLWASARLWFDWLTMSGSGTPTRRYSAGPGARPGYHRQVKKIKSFKQKINSFSLQYQGTESPVGYGERIDRIRRMSGSGNMLFPTGMGEWQMANI